MEYGELKRHSADYQDGHLTGSIRAYDDAITWFEEVLASEKPGTKHTTEAIIQMLQYCKELWIEHCNSYGMAEVPED